MYGAANLRMEAGLRRQQSCSQIQLRARQRAIASVKSPVTCGRGNKTLKLLFARN